MRVLVTGGLGHVGREVVRHLAEHGYDVRSLDRGARPSDATWEHVVGDLTDPRDMRRAVEGVDAVVHAGAIPHDRAGFADEVFRVNVFGTLMALQACAEAGVARVVNFSSVNSLGNFGGHRPAAYLPIDDAYPRHPQTPYQLSKHLAEEACAAFADRHGMTCISLRPVAVIHGAPFWRWRSADPWQRAEWGKGDYWAYVDVRDVAEAVRLSLVAPEGRSGEFLLAAEDTTQELPTLDLLARFYADTPWRGAPKEDYFRDNPNRGLLDCTQAFEALGWRPVHSWRTSSP
jgi:nucleoside-diphosphate-sugar epimerase